MLDYTTSAFLFMALAATGINFYVKYSYTYWDRHGVPSAPATFPYGNFGEQFTQKMALGEQLDIYYQNTTSPIIGIYGVLKPMLLVRDPDLIRNVLIKDFQHFVDRGVYHDEKNDPLSGGLFTIEGDHWMQRRKKFTPTFTSGKMKSIFSTLLNAQKTLQEHLSKMAESNEVVEVRELASCYTTNVIASVAFGIEVDTLADPNNPFRAYGRQFFDMTTKNAFRFFCFGFNPTLLKWSGIRLVDSDVEDFFMDMVNQTLKMREENNIVRKDFFQLLVQLRNSGSVQNDDDWQTTVSNNKDLTLEELAAQAFIFYLAGFETTATTISFALYEIARNPEIQERIFNEIENVVAENGGELSYDALSELKYLEAVIDETLRKYPVVQALNRVCTKPYTIPGTNITIEKGTSVIIPAYSLHRDEKYYPDPLKFDPTRFLAENKGDKTFADRPYLPFGSGPRNCIGMRMGKMSTKVGLASMIQNFRVELGPQHDPTQELIYSPKSFVLASKNGVNVKFVARNP